MDENNLICIKFGLTVTKIKGSHVWGSHIWQDIYCKCKQIQFSLHEVIHRNIPHIFKMLELNNTFLPVKQKKSFTELYIPRMSKCVLVNIYNWKYYTHMFFVFMIRMYNSFALPVQQHILDKSPKVLVLSVGNVGELLFLPPPTTTFDQFFCSILKNGSRGRKNRRAIMKYICICW